MPRPRIETCACGTQFLARDGGGGCPSCGSSGARLCDGCGTLFTPAADAIHPERCRRCSGLVCRECGGLAAAGGICAGCRPPLIEEVLAEPVPLRRVGESR